MNVWEILLGVNFIYLKDTFGDLSNVMVFGIYMLCPSVKHIIPSYCSSSRSVAEDIDGKSDIE